MEYNSQVIQTLILSTDAKIVNNTMFSYTKRDTFNSDGYSEIIDPSWFIDNRTEFILMKPSVTINTGLEEKYQSTRAYDDFFFEPVNVWDLSNRAFRVDLNSYLAKSGGGGFLGTPVPGFEDRYATPALGTFGPGSGNGGGLYFNLNNDTNVSEAASVSPYFQATWKLAPTWNLVTGARMDIMHVETSDPFNPGAIGLHRSRRAEHERELGRQGQPRRSRPTLTYNYSQNYTGDLADGGGFGLYADAKGNPTIPRGLFSGQSQLFEVGAKFQLDEQQAVHQQRRLRPDEAEQAAGLPRHPVHVLRVRALAQLPAEQAVLRDHRLLVDQRQLARHRRDVPVPGLRRDPAPRRSAGAHRGEPPVRPAACAPPASRSTRSTRSPRTRSRAASGFESNILVTSPMNNDYQGYLVIPTQYSLDAEIFYKAKKWEVRLSGTNVTNQHNWEPSVATYALEGIVPLPGAQMFATFKYKF